MTGPPPDEPPVEEAIDPGFVPPDPDEPPPLELWRAVGDVPPWGTTLLLLSWAVVFALFVFRHELGDNSALYARGASAAGGTALETAWRLLASTFLHAGVLHLVFNGATMLVFGPAVERIYTRWGFWILYAGGGAAASLASLMWRSARPGSGASISVGASGAIFALGGALLIGAFRLRRRLAPGRARALGAAMLFLVFQGLSGGFTNVGTDNAAHAAGLTAGSLLATAIPLSERLGGRPPGIVIRALGTLAALALAATFALILRRG